jgi:hypothetical protein
MQIKFDFDEENIKTITVRVLSEGDDEENTDHFTQVFRTFTVTPITKALEDKVKLVSDENGTFVFESENDEDGRIVLHAIYRNLYILVKLAENKVFSATELDQEAASKVIQDAQDVPIDEVKKYLNLEEDVK